MIMADRIAETTGRATSVTCMLSCLAMNFVLVEADEWQIARDPLEEALHR
jgi:hypothetical protein